MLCILHAHILVAFTEPSRQSDWDSIIACHRGLSMTTTWNYHKSTMGSHKIEPNWATQDEYRHATATVSINNIILY